MGKKMASHYLASLASNRGRFWIQEFMQLFIQLSTAQASTEGFPPVSSFWLHLRHAIPWSWSTGAVMNHKENGPVELGDCRKHKSAWVRKHALRFNHHPSAGRCPSVWCQQHEYRLFNSARFGFLPLNCCILPAISDSYKAEKSRRAPWEIDVELGCKLHS